MMRCETCDGEVRFVDGTWAHVAETSCAGVVVHWPDPVADDEDEVAA